MRTAFIRAALHHPLEAAAEIFNARSQKSRLVVFPKQDAALSDEDGLWTYHRTPFLHDQRFQQAYARAVRAGGFDYGIRWRVHTILWAASLGAKLPGAFVECGTGKGFMASAICEYLEWTDRPFYLFDTFAPASREHQRERPFYAEGPEAVRANFAQWPGVQLVVGTIPDTLLDTGPTAFLHVDLNDVTPEAEAIRHFWPRLSPGAPMVLDDYGFPGYEEQQASADRLGQELGFSVLCLPTGQGLAIKAPR